MGKTPWTPARAPSTASAAKMHGAEAEATGNLLGLDLANTSVIPGLMLRDDFFSKPLEPRYALPERTEHLPYADVQFHTHIQWKKSAPPSTPGWYASLCVSLGAKLHGRWPYFRFPSREAAAGVAPTRISSHTARIIVLSLNIALPSLRRLTLDVRRKPPSQPTDKTKLLMHGYAALGQSTIASLDLESYGATVGRRLRRDRTPAAHAEQTGARRPAGSLLKVGGFPRYTRA